jgi:peptidyl-prolyl cis-trans isomerase A (cyclophilin A)
MIRPATTLLAAFVLALAPASAAQLPAPVRTLANPNTLTEQAPATYRVNLDTSEGPVVIEVTRAWAPRGADRFYNLVKNGFYDEARFFRVLPGFMAQFGINANPQLSAAWRQARIADDPVTQSNQRGYVTFATGGPDARTTQVFINFKGNSALDRQGFAPFGRVVSGMEAVEKLYAGYGEGAPDGPGPDQFRVQLEGNRYLNASYPMLDFIRRATIAP